MGFSPERDAAHWSRASAIAKPRLALTIPVHVYRKLGTTVETQLMVFDKVQEEIEIVRAMVDDLDAARQIIDDIAATRTATPSIQTGAQFRTGSRRVGVPVARQRPIAQAASAKPKSHAAIPLAFTCLDTPPRENTPPVSDIYARYRPQRIEITGGLRNIPRRSSRVLPWPRSRPPRFRRMKPPRTCGCLAI